MIRKIMPAEFTWSLLHVWSCWPEGCRFLLLRASLSDIANIGPVIAPQVGRNMHEIFTFPSDSWSMDQTMACDNPAPLSDSRCRLQFERVYGAIRTMRTYCWCDRSVFVQSMFATWRRMCRIDRHSSTSLSWRDTFGESQLSWAPLLLSEIIREQSLSSNPKKM